MPANGAQELRLFENEGGPIIQVEINLEEAPLFMIRRKDEDSDAQTIESRSIALTRNGDRLEQYWKVTAHRDFALPGAVDEAERASNGPPEGGSTGWSVKTMPSRRSCTWGRSSRTKARKSAISPPVSRKQLASTG